MRDWETLKGNMQGIPIFMLAKFIRLVCME